jgi:hypothetical protein
VQRDGAALRESRDHDAPRLDAERALGRDQRAEPGERLAKAGLVRAPLRGERLDVIPGTHPHAHVERHRADRRVREHEADARVRGQLQLRHDRHEVVPVGTEAVQPDHAGRGLRRGRQDDGIRGFL